MRVSRRRGVIRLHLDAVEKEVLAHLIDELDELIDVMEPDDEVTQRLFPSAHRDDEQAAAQFRELTEEGLRDARRVKYGVIRAALPLSGEAIEITADEQSAWLTSVNDIRLALGTRLGVTEEEPDIDPSSAQAQTWSLYYWLTGLQDAMVRAAMR
jgi:hypothetical protein